LKVKHNNEIAGDPNKINNINKNQSNTNNNNDANTINKNHGKAQDDYDSIFQFYPQ